jgi:plasmid maintenance system killer protein
MIHPFAGNMKVLFASRQLMRCYEDSDRAMRKWGPNVGRKYIARVQALYAANKFSDLFTIRSLAVHELKGGHEGQYAVILHGRWRLVVVPEGEDTVRVEEVTHHYGD